MCNILIAGSLRILINVITPATMEIPVGVLLYYNNIKFNTVNVIEYRQNKKT